MAGPGVKRGGIDNETWTDHTDIVLTMMRLLGLATDYQPDPCVLDTFAAAIHQARTGETLPWWHFSRARKRAGADTARTSAAPRAAADPHSDSRYGAPTGCSRSCSTCAAAGLRRPHSSRNGWRYRSARFTAT
jgi:hypothetical protein